MSYPNLNENPVIIQVERADYSNLSSVLKDYYDNKGIKGALLYDTDTEQFLIHNGSVYTPPVIAVSPPSSASDSGVAGQISYDSSYIYICTATDTWKRASIATW